QAAHEFAERRLGPHGFRGRAIALLQRAEACSLRREIAGNQTASTTGRVDYGRHTTAAFGPSRAAVPPASPTRADLSRRLLSYYLRAESPLLGASLHRPSPRIVSQWHQTTMAHGYAALERREAAACPAGRADDHPQCTPPSRAQL